MARQSTSGGAESEVVKVLDFGLSKDLGTQSVRRTAPGTIVGTVEYVSPEGTTGDSALVDFRSDQWALAVVTYRMLAGRLPFEGKGILGLLTAIQSDPPSPLRSHAPTVPDHVVAAIERALAKKKEDRFESVPDFVRGLNGLPSLSQSIRGQVGGQLGGQRFARLGAVKVVNMTRLPDPIPGSLAALPAPAPEPAPPVAAPAAAKAPLAASATSRDSREYSLHVETDPSPSRQPETGSQRRLLRLLIVLIVVALAVLGFLLVQARQRWTTQTIPTVPAATPPVSPATAQLPTTSLAPPVTVPKSGFDQRTAPIDAGAAIDSATAPADLTSGRGDLSLG